MKNIKPIIKALLTVGDDPVLAIDTALANTIAGTDTSRDRNLMLAMRQDALDFARSEKAKVARDFASDKDNVIAPPVSK